MESGYNATCLNYFNSISRFKNAKRLAPAPMSDFKRAKTGTRSPEILLPMVISEPRPKLSPMRAFVDEDMKTDTPSNIQEESSSYISLADRLFPISAPDEFSQQSTASSIKPDSCNIIEASLQGLSHQGSSSSIGDIVLQPLVPRDMFALVGLKRSNQPAVVPQETQLKKGPNGFMMDGDIETDIPNILHENRELLEQKIKDDEAAAQIAAEQRIELKKAKALEQKQKKQMAAAAKKKEALEKKKPPEVKNDDEEQKTQDQDWIHMFYKNSNAYAIRRRHGDKKQIFSFKSSTKPFNDDIKNQLLAIANMCLDKLKAGVSESDVETWAKAQMA